MIASRFPLAHPRRYLLHNPRISAEVRGDRWVLHDKGLLGATAMLAETGRTLRIHSLHLFPFFEFGVADGNRYVEDMWTEFWDYVDRTADGQALILAGDFNQASRISSAKLRSRFGWKFCIGYRATAENGLVLDDVAVNWHAEVTDQEALPTFSDHRLVVVELNLPAAMEDPGSTGPQRHDSSGS